MRSLDILDRLIAFPTISTHTNLSLMEYVSQLLDEAGIDCSLFHNESGDRANLYARVGPADRPGVMLSGHTDVVPIEGQRWSVEPFALTRRDGKLYGRGTADMKGFVACALDAFLSAADRDLATPLEIALSYDEEIGCIGVRHLLDSLAQSSMPPSLCIVGEPTSLSVATGHKGKAALHATCCGREAHSALAPTALNALHLAGDFMAAIRRKQEEIQRSGRSDPDYDIPYTTLHIGKISGGVALNIVPNSCELDFEIRTLAEDSWQEIVEDLKESARKIVEPYRQDFPEAAIEIDVRNAYPGLDTAPDSDAVAFVKSLTGANSTMKVAFGTEGGLFNERLGTPTVICGPGSMAQGHKPDEFVTIDQMEQCCKMLDNLIDRLCA